VDEHYFSTLLAMQKRDQETDCKGGLVSTHAMHKVTNHLVLLS
jgi:hypothetical protein